MIAIGLACNPKLIIADEPTTALDVTIQAQILKLMKDLSRDLGIAMVIITHNLGIVARYADRVNVMYAGAHVGTGHGARSVRAPAASLHRGLVALRAASRPAAGRQARDDRRHAAESARSRRWAAASLRAASRRCRNRWRRSRRWSKWSAVITRPACVRTRWRASGPKAWDSWALHAWRRRPSRSTGPSRS